MQAVTTEPPCLCNQHIPLETETIRIKYESGTKLNTTDGCEYMYKTVGTYFILLPLITVWRSVVISVSISVSVSVFVSYICMIRICAVTSSSAVLGSITRGWWTHCVFKLCSIDVCCKLFQSFLLFVMHSKNLRSLGDCELVNFFIIYTLKLLYLLSFMGHYIQKHIHAQNVFFFLFPYNRYWHQFWYHVKTDMKNKTHQLCCAI